jgi:hypothetical protein
LEYQLQCILGIFIVIYVPGISIAMID